MRRVVVNRIVMAVPLLWAVATLMFLLLQLVPGDPAQTILGGQGTPDQVAQVRTRLGLNDPVLTQYGHWMVGLLHGNLGRSAISGESVLTILNQRAPVTLSLAMAATLVSVLVGVALGVISAISGGWGDRIIRSGVGVSIAMPNFWLAAGLVLIFSIWLGLLPSVGYVSIFESPGGWLYYMILPVAAVAAASISVIVRQTRAAMRAALQSEYVQTLRGVGLSRRSIIFKHGLRNASIPVVTIIGWQFVSLLSGAVLVEQVFALPGLGRLTVDATNDHDFTVLQGLVVYSTALVLVVNLIVDLAYLWLSPKVRQQ